MALGQIISADGNVTSFSYENTQNTLQINNSLTILGPNIIIEFAEGAENADLEAEYVNYLNKVSRNSSASLNTFMSHPIVSVFKVTTASASPSMTFDAASTLEEACALTTTRIGRISSPATIGSIVFEYYQVDGNITVWDPINAGTYAMTFGGAKNFITVLEGGYVSSVEICPIELTFDNIAGKTFYGPQYAGCEVALDETFGLTEEVDGYPSSWYQLYILDAGNYRPATYDDIQYGSYMALEFNYDERQPVPGERFIVSVREYDGAIMVTTNEGQC